MVAAIGLLAKKRWVADRTLQGNMGILAFEAARTMSRLVALHRALSAAELARLRSNTTRSTGIAYLNSTDQLRLLRLACAELLDDLDSAAAAVSRLAGRCSGPREFLHFYRELKSGSGDLGRGFHGRDVETAFGRMERRVSAVAELQASMEGLAELEASGRRRRRKDGEESLQREVDRMRLAVRKLQTECMWSESKRTVGELMARAVVTIFTRICAVFAPVAIELPLVVPQRNGRYRFSAQQRLLRPFFSAPLGDSAAGCQDVRHSGPLASTVRECAPAGLEAPAGTLGEAGLALRYAQVIGMAGRMLAGEGCCDGEAAREELYKLLPAGMRGKLRAKLRGCGRGVGGGAEEGRVWREAAERMLEWLGPMAEDTESWYERRCCERRDMRGAEEERKVLALQTLVFSDMEKAEAAVVEVLVALSCVWRCKQQRSARNPCAMR